MVPLAETLALALDGTSGGLLFVEAHEALLEAWPKRSARIIRGANEDLSRSRVVLEVKCVELEEQRDRWATEERELKQRMEVMRKELEVRSP